MSMDQMSSVQRRSTDYKMEVWITVLFFAVSLIEIIAEYIKFVPMIYTAKPLIIVILAFLYWKTSHRPNAAYLCALLFSWLANLFFISQDFKDIFVGALLFFIYRGLTIYVVIRYIKLPGIFPIVVGCVPFLFIYMYLINLTYDAFGEGLIIFITQCIMISFLGGLAVGNYILRSSRASTMLLMSTMFSAITQFIFVIRLYYVNVNIFQPLAMALFVAGQFMFYKFVIFSEEATSNVKIMDNVVKDSEIL